MLVLVVRWGNLLVEGTASHTQIVAGAVLGVGQVGRGRVSGGAAHIILALSSHQDQAATHLSLSLSLSLSFPTHCLPLECHHCHCADKDPQSHYISGSRDGSDSEAESECGRRDKD